MVRRTVSITQGGAAEWQGNKGRDPFKTRAHYVMVVVFVVGLLAILAVGIWIGVDKNKQDNSQAKPIDLPTVPVIERLREVLSSKDNAYISNFTNWDETTHIKKVYVVHPIDASEVQKVISVAGELGLKIRPIGSGLSYSNLFPDENQILLRTDLLNKRQNGDPFYYDPVESTVSAAAGLTMGDLVEFVVANRIQVDAMPSAAEITLGGAISTATHGRNPEYGSLSDQVVAVRFVDGRGDLRTADSTSPEDLKRIKCCIGMCGVIYDITFKVRPLATVKVVQGFESGHTILRNASFLDRVLYGFSGLELFFAPLSSVSDVGWDGYSATGRLPASYDPWEDEWWYRIFEEVPEVPQGVRRRRSTEELPPLLTGNLDIDVTNNTMTTTPSVTFTELLSHKYAYDYTMGLVESTPEVPQPYPEATVRYSVNDLQLTYSVAFIIPQAEDTNTQVVRALDIAFGVLQEYIDEGKVPILTIELRWVAASKDCVMCPGSYDEDAINHVISIELIGASYKANYLDYARKVMTLLDDEWPGVRLEWAKFYDTMEDIDDFIRVSRTEALDLMTKNTAGSSVKLWDIFISNFLYDVVGDE